MKFHFLKIPLFKFIPIYLIAASTLAFAQQPVQTIKGTIVDKESQFPLPGVTVILVGSDPVKGTVSDVNGKFRLENVPIGRQTIQVSFIGYQTITMSNLLVTSGKELALQIALEEDLENLEEVVAIANDKRETINKMATVSARTFSVEEAARYSGSWNDPSRMAQNYAGVSGASDDRNDIIIRGNSPTGVLWRMEGIDIPSPNHFATVGTTGSGISMLNINNLSNSDFMTSAWSADYGNALSGVFDLKLRNGNADKGEYLAQVGANGLEFGAEGPFKKGGRASFMANYRYSTLEVFDAIGIDLGTGDAIPEYQDLTFKLNLPTEKAGVFSIWGIGGISFIHMENEGDDESNLYADLSSNPQDIKFGSSTGVIGASHLYFFNDHTFSKLMLAASGTQVTGEVDEIIDTLPDPYRLSGFNYIQNKYSLHWKLNKKFNKKNTGTFGIIYDINDINIKDSARFASLGNQIATISDFTGLATLAQSYLQWQHKFNNDLTLNSGLHYQHFIFNNTNSIEPRFGIRYKLNPQHTFNLGAGIHSQTQPIVIYFREDRNLSGSSGSGEELPNKDLGFSKAAHFVLGHDFFLSENVRLKTEIYYQSLYNIAIDTASSTFSMINAGADFELPNRTGMENTGTGFNYGMEFTLERFYNKGYYYLTTLSLFESKYRGSDGVLRNTIFNGNFVYNALGGKEFILGSSEGKRKKVLSFDTKFTMAGGRRYTPIDRDASLFYQQQVLIDSLAYTEQNPLYVRLDAKVSFRLEGQKTTHWWSLDIQNVTDRDNVFRQVYNPAKGEISYVYQRGFFPVAQYKLLF